MIKPTLRLRVPVRAVAFMTTAALLAGAGVARFASVNAQSATNQNQLGTVIVNVDPPVVPVKAKPAKKHRWYQLGMASWYGSAFQGPPTASGEDFDMNDLTAAHRNLPLGTLLRVTNLRNKRSVIVRVNDRGPVPEDRVIDLSYAAAETLGFSERGIAPVKVEFLPASSEVAQLNLPDTPQPSR